MNVKEIEKEMIRLVEKMKKDDKDLNTCLEYLKLFESVTYLECCGFLNLSFHANDTFGEFRDYASIAKIRLNK